MSWLNDTDRLYLVLTQVANRRLTYKELTGKTGNGGTGKTSVLVLTERNVDQKKARRQRMKCSISGCKGKVIAGFQAYIPAPDMDNPYNFHLDPIPWVWCEDHEDYVRDELIRDREGRNLNLEQIEYIEKSPDFPQH